MKRLLAAALGLGLAGCLAHVTPHGTYIEPLVDVVLVGPPVVVAPPPAITFRPLPPAWVVPDRHVYHYDNAYYYFWGDAWYWGRDRKGPWHALDRRYWPPRTERHRDYDDHGRGGPKHR